MKTLVITGASKGIGLATAKQFADAGYRVINLSRTPAPDSRIENHGIDLAYSDFEQQLAELMALVLDQGEICLVHNAGRMTNDTALDTDTTSFTQVLNVNLVAPHIINQIILPRMAPGSSVIYIGSTLSEKAVPGTYSYVVSKHGLIGMMRATCQDLAGRGIHTTCICPGFTDTEMLRIHVGDDARILEGIGNACTFGRLVTPAEIANAIWFAANNPVINGSVIHANLGQVER
ncbi:MAG: SDR family NAD(P)-dependent oxidoreductase [Pseudomonadota bacterium]